MRTEIQLRSALHYIVKCGAHFQALYCTRTTSGLCPALQLLSLPVRFRLEEFFSGECKYGNDVPGIPFYFPFLPRTFRLLPHAFFFYPALFFALALSYIYLLSSLFPCSPKCG